MAFVTNLDTRFTSSVDLTVAETWSLMTLVMEAFEDYPDQAELSMMLDYDFADMEINQNQYKRVQVLGRGSPPDANSGLVKTEFVITAKWFSATTFPGQLNDVLVVDFRSSVRYYGPKDAVEAYEANVLSKRYETPTLFELALRQSEEDTPVVNND